MTLIRPHPEHGMTLTEVMIVMALAALVVLGLVGFYMSSQAVWMDGSSQAITQRDATLLVATITENVRRAARAVVVDDGSPPNQTLYLFPDKSPATQPFRCYYLKDSRVYFGSDQPRDGDTLVVVSPVDQFQLETVDSTLVLMNLIELPTSKGPPVRLASAAALYNR